MTIEWAIRQYNVNIQRFEHDIMVSIRSKRQGRHGAWLIDTPLRMVSLTNDSPQSNATVITTAWPSVSESVLQVRLGVTVFCTLALPRVILVVTAKEEHGPWTRVVYRRLNTTRIHGPCCKKALSYNAGRIVVHSFFQRGPYAVHTTRVHSSLLRAVFTTRVHGWRFWHPWTRPMNTGSVHRALVRPWFQKCAAVARSLSES